MSVTLPSAFTGEAQMPQHSAVRAVPLWPRNAVIAALHGYRAVISPLYGDVCRYYPTCSAYAVGAVQQYGAVRGSVLALARICRCHPWAAGGEDDVRPHPRFRHQLTPRGYVVPSPAERNDS